MNSRAFYKIALMGLIIGASMNIYRLLSPVYAKDKPATPTFDQQYEAQVLKTNAALRTFTDTSCTATEFPAATDALKTELTTLNSLYKTIPDSEDILVQAHETELYIGLVTIATQAADDQLDCEHQSAPTEQDSHSTKS